MADVRAVGGAAPGKWVSLPIDATARRGAGWLPARSGRGPLLPPGCVKSGTWGEPWRTAPREEQ
ncbi:hypothetical protein [Streptomyces leeuwenhoekii]|uniref:hypothetical protein n=1 Tax=Streptomyces leeuwenhoekii TaxID=1437453 RepID=UPI0012FF54CC|nr:hypothetical protein [Streptomyces leeuwenhoekii]